MDNKTDRRLLCDAIPNNPYSPGTFSDRVHKILLTQYVENKIERDGLLRDNIKNLLYGDNPNATRLTLLELSIHFNGLVGEFREHFRKWLRSNSWKVNEKEYEFWIDKWNKTAIEIRELRGANYLLISEAIHITLYNVLREFESEYGWIPKGVPLFEIGFTKFVQGSPKFKTYMYLALVDDIIADIKGKNRGEDFKSKGKAAYNVLKDYFSESEVYLNSYKDIVDTYLEKVKVKKRDASSEQFLVYPEEILVWYYTNKEYKDRRSNCLDFDTVYSSQLLDKIRKERSNNRKGWLFEQLIAYILLSQSNYEVLCNIRTIKHEDDLRLRNTVSNDPFLSELGSYILVEAKNTKAKTDVQRVNYFISKVISSGCNTGLLFSLSGITGEIKDEDAYYTIRQVYHKNNIAILVFKEQEIKDIVEGKRVFYDQLLEKYENRRFDEKKEEKIKKN